MADYPSKYTGDAIDDAVEFIQQITVSAENINTLNGIDTETLVQDQLDSKYTWPGTGRIPYTDLADAVQGNLDLAVTAEQPKYKSSEIYIESKDDATKYSEYLKKYPTVKAVYDYTNQETKSKYTYKKVCMYFGQPDLVNNLGTTTKCIEFYSNYDLVIFGADYAHPTHSAYTNTKVICTGLVAAGIEVYGYVDIAGTTLDNVETYIKEWYDLSCTGVYLDNFEYAVAGETTLAIDREKQNEFVEYSHDLGLKVIVDSDNIDSVFSSAYDITFNPKAVDPKIGMNDYFTQANLFYEAENATTMKNGCIANRIHDIYKYRTDVHSDIQDTWENYYQTKILCFDSYASELSQLEKNELATISIFGNAILNIDAIAICDEAKGLVTKTYWNWAFPADLILYPAPNSIFTEYTKNDASGDSYYYKFSNIINNHLYSLFLNYSSAIDYSFSRHKMSILDGDGIVVWQDQIVNAWDLYERKSNKTQELTSESTHQQFPTAKIVYDKLEEEHAYVGTNDLTINYIHNNTDASGEAIIDSVTFNANSHIDDSITIVPDLATTTNFGEIRVGHNLEIGSEGSLHALPGIVVSDGVVPTHERDYFWLDTSLPGYDIDAIEHLTNKVVSIDATSTDSQYPTARAVWETIKSVVSDEMEIPR